MKLLPYWRDSAPAFASAAPGEVAGSYDVAVIGAGFTGLGAARRLAMEGRQRRAPRSRDGGFRRLGP